MVRKLLRGEEVMYREGKRERAIRFLHPDHGYINLKDTLPIHIAAEGPNALQLAGEIGDGWISFVSDPGRFRRKLEEVKKGAARARRSLRELPISILTSGCILHDGESATSPRVVQRMGPIALAASLHGLWEAPAMANRLPGPRLELWERYRVEYVATMKTPPERRYLEVHEGHLIYMKPGEEKYVAETLVRATTLTGRGEEIIARLKALESEGARQVAIQVVPPFGREMIEDFSREVIAKY